MRAHHMYKLCAVAIIGVTLGCGGEPNKRSEPVATTDLDKTFSSILEDSWNFYLTERIFLGPTYFGNTTSGGRDRGSLHALKLLSDFPTYQALATKGFIKLDELNLADAPPGVFSGGAKIERAATVSLTEAGAKAGDLDKQANTVTFVLGKKRVGKIALNTLVPAGDGSYRLVEGTQVLEVKPEFADLWAELGWPTYPNRRFRVLFKHDITDLLFRRLGQEWQVAIASNGRFTAEDTGPLDGNFESDNVPPTIDQLRLNRR